jgi:DNA gyrase subunit A
MASEQKLKEGDRVLQTIEAGNNRDLLFFTNSASVYKCKANDFAFTKASAMGDFVATKLAFDAGELPVYMVSTADYSGYLLFFFENGKAAKVELGAYATKTNRR